MLDISQLKGDVARPIPGKEDPKDKRDKQAIVSQSDHVNLANKGTNTHAQLDSHLSGTSAVHGLGTGEYVLGTTKGASYRVESKTGSVSADVLEVKNISISWDTAFNTIVACVAVLRLDDDAVYQNTWGLKSYSTTGAVLRFVNSTGALNTFYADFIAIGT